MSIGYACITIGQRDLKFKSCMLKNATEDRLKEIIEHNICVLEQQIEYNAKNEIKVFRISSDIIPFGSHPINQIPWWETYGDKLKKLGDKIRDSGLRVTMHPGQYTVLNSPRTDVVAKAVDDLIYHTMFLDSLGAPSRSKIILHVGGTYGDKDESLLRFQENYLKLPKSIKRRLVIENDEKCYNIEEVLYLGKQLSIPVIFDNLHHSINPPKEENDDPYWIKEAGLTWSSEDGKQKIHYSQQCLKGNKGAHSQSIDVSEFVDYYEKINGRDIDIMLEVKDKDLSAIKCIHCTDPNLRIMSLEIEWAKYKYVVLGKSAAVYNGIRQILKDKNSPKALEFYLSIERALAMPENKGAENNAALHVWGYFKKVATENEQKIFYEKLSKYMDGKSTLREVKRFLEKLAIKYEISYLLNSHYFYLP